MLVRIVGGHGGVAPGFRATSYVVDGKLLIDAGSIASGVIIEEQVLIENILISHPHLDHIGQLAFLCDNCFGLKEKPFDVYTNEPVKDAIKTHLMNDIIWPDFSKIPTPEHPTIKFHGITPEVKMTIGDYSVLPVRVNHPGEAVGYIVESNKRPGAIVFTQDTGPTDRIWELAQDYSKINAIFTEVSFPNSLQNVADASFHHTPNTLAEEIEKMPDSVPIFVGHLKPNFQTQLYQEIDALKNDRISLLGSDDTNYVF